MSLEIFDDLMNITDVAVTGRAKHLTNLATKSTYILPRFLRNPEGGGQTEIFQGGKKIRMYRMFDEKSTRKHYRPAEPQKWTRPQVTDFSEVEWRYTVDHMSWTDQEVEFNTGGMNREGRKAGYKNFKDVLETRFWTSMMNGFEDDLFAQPDFAGMVSAGGLKPFSIPCFVNENADGLMPAAAGGAWTTVEGVDPTVESKWVCNQRTYTENPGGLGPVPGLRQDVPGCPVRPAPRARDVLGAEDAGCVHRDQHRGLLELLVRLAHRPRPLGDGWPSRPGVPWSDVRGYPDRACVEPRHRGALPGGHQHYVEVRRARGHRQARPALLLVEHRLPEAGLPQEEVHEEAGRPNRHLDAGDESPADRVLAQPHLRSPEPPGHRFPVR